MGADRAILVKADKPDTWGVARLLGKIAEKEKPTMILMGKQAIDDDSNVVGQLLAELLAWPQATFISELKLLDGNTAQCVREVDGGLETVKLPLPAVITADLRLNEPRYASLPGIMKARKKPLEEIDAGSLGVDLKPRLTVKSLSPPAARKAGRKVESVDELLQVLQREAKVL
jgi:electron transfer flavoprotein beta subunit